MSRSSWDLPAVNAVLVGLMVFSYFVGRLPPETFAHGDLIALMASTDDCVAGRGCQLRQAPPSIAGIHHGGGFIAHLATAQVVGASVRASEWGVAALIAVSFALLFLVLARRVGSIVAMLGVLLPFMPLVLAEPFAMPDGAVFWNPSLLPPLAALFLGGACCYLLDPRPRYLLAAAIGASLTLSFHAAGVITLVILVGLIMATPSRDRGLGWLILGLTALFVAQTQYPTAFLDLIGGAYSQNAVGERIAAAFQRPLMLVARLSPYAVLTLGTIAAVRRPRTSHERRLLSFLALTHLPLDAFLMLVAPFDPRYRFVLSPGMGLLVAIVITTLVGHTALGTRLARSQRRSRALGLSALILLFSIPLLPGVPPIHIHSTTLPTLADVDAVIEELTSRGWTVEEALLGATGNELVRKTELRHAFAPFAHRFPPGDGDQPRPRARFELSILEKEAVEGRSAWYLGRPPDINHSSDEALVDSGPPPAAAARSARPVLATGGRVDDPRGSLIRERRGVSLLLREYEPFVDWRAYTACYFGMDGNTCECTDTRRELEARAHVIDYSRSSTLLSKRVAGTDDRPGTDSVWVFRAPLRVPAGGRPRAIAVPPLSEAYPCEGAILEVEGLFEAPSMPATVIRAEGREQALEGSVTFAWDLSSPSCMAEDTPLPLPSVTERDAFEAVEPVRAPPAWAASVRTGALDCLRSTARTPPRRSDSVPHPEPLTPLWYVLLLTTLQGVMLALGFALCLRRGR